MISRNGSDVGMQMNTSTHANIPSFFQAPPTVDGSISPLRIPSDMDSRSESKTLMRVFYESGQYWIDHPERGRDASKTLWLVIRQSKYPCMLSSGDMLKMGRYKIRVREAVSDTDVPILKGKRFSVCSTDSYDNDLETFAPDEDLVDGSPTVASSQHPLVNIQSLEVCRICYDSGEEANPLISPCKCSGSMQYVHLQCLRKWMDGRLSVNNGDQQNKSSAGATTVSYFWRNLDCELCKLSYPTSVECPSKASSTGVETVDLYELPKPEGPYIVLESNIRVPIPPTSSTSSASGVSFQKGLHIMSLSKGRSSVQFGRGHDADIRINDISVSRLHGTIRLVQATVNGVRKQQILIEDKGSKFGSLIAIRGPVPLEPGVPVSIQSGRTVTTVTVRKPNLLSNIIPLCFGSSSRAANQASLNTAATPVLLSESSPSVDLKQVLEGSGMEPPRESPQRAGMRASVASTAMRRASEALSSLHDEEQIQH